MDGELTDDRFGGSVALSSDGTTVAAGAHRNDKNGPDSGQIRVLQLLCWKHRKAVIDHFG